MKLTRNNINTTPRAAERSVLGKERFYQNRGSVPQRSFRLSADGPVPAFYWLDQGFGYALSGSLGRDALLALATAVHQQL